MRLKAAVGPKCRLTNVRPFCIESPMRWKLAKQSSHRSKPSTAVKIYAQAEEDIQNFVDTFRYFADLAQTVNYRNVIAVRNHEAWVARHPWGPCGFIIPWNFPFLLAGWGLGPALAAGNTCVLKPAEDTPLSALYLCHVIQELDLLPAGVLNIVTGTGETAGAAVSGNNPKFRRMSFTGLPGSRPPWSPKPAVEISFLSNANLVAKVLLLCSTMLTFRRQRKNSSVRSPTTPGRFAATRRGG